MVTYEKRTSTHTTRHNGTCKRCKRVYTKLTLTTVVRTYRSDIIAPPSRQERTTLADGSPDRGTECCGVQVRMLPVKGRVRLEEPCGAKCLGSTGHVCECSCGGRNHGAGHAR